MEATATTPTPLFTSKDLVTDQDIRWCPGCGDYSILKQVQTVIPELGLPREQIVFISGIGCSSRFHIIWRHMACTLFMEEQLQ